MGTKLLILLVIFVAFVAPRIYHAIISLGLHKSYYKHHPGPCRILKNIKYGAEDFELLPDDTVLITSGLHIFGAYEKDVPEDFGPRVFKFDMKQPDRDPVELSIRGLPKADDFNPHGISSWVDNGDMIIYIISHFSDHSVVISFTYRNDVLTYRATHGEGDSTFLVVNDLIVVGKDQFYFTNFQYVRSAPVEILFNIPWASVGYFDGRKGRVVVPGITAGNGINISPDSKYIYVSEMGKQRLHSYIREADNSLVEIETVPLYTMVDNIMVDKDTGDLWLGCHYSLAKLMQNAPLSQVLRLKMTAGHVTDITEVLMDDGTTLPGSSVAIHRHNKLLVGSVHKTAMICDAKCL